MWAGSQSIIVTDRLTSLIITSTYRNLLNYRSSLNRGSYLLGNQLCDAHCGPRLFRGISTNYYHAPYNSSIIIIINLHSQGIVHERRTRMGTRSYRGKFQDIVWGWTVRREVPLGTGTLWWGPNRRGQFVFMGTDSLCATLNSSFSSTDWDNTTTRNMKAVQKK